MLAIVIGILFGILLLLLIWYITSIPSSKNVVVIGGSDLNPANGILKEKTPPLGSSNVVQTLTDFAVGLFDKVNGKTIDTNPLVARFVNTICGNNVFASDTLKEYVTKVSSAANIPISKYSKSEHTPTDTEYLDDIRRISNTLNGVFGDCSKRSDTSYGLIFGVLANSVLAYKLALDRGEVQKAEEIRDRMIGHIQKIHL